MTVIKCFDCDCVFNHEGVCSSEEIEISNGSCMNEISENEESEIIGDEWDE